MEIPLVRTISRILESREAITVNTPTRANTNNINSTIINRDDFLVLLLAQLKNQDPLNSLSVEDFTSQLVQFSTLDTILQQSENINQLLDKALRLEALNLLGKKVRVGDKVGIVSKITFEEGSPKIWIDGESYNMSLVSEVLTNG